MTGWVFLQPDMGSWPVCLEHLKMQGSFAKFYVKCIVMETFGGRQMISRASSGHVGADLLGACICQGAAPGQQTI